MSTREPPGWATPQDPERDEQRTPLRVLIVEDSVDDTLLLLRELRRGGYEPQYERVDTAEIMRTALEKQDWDVVVSDHAMPSFSAPAALKSLQDGGWLDIPFIIVSGHIGEDAAVKAMKAGAHDFVSKDGLARLAPAIERELRDAEERRERRRAQEALHEAGHLLGSTLEPEEIATRLLEIMRRISGLTAAGISLSEAGQLRIWRSIGLENLKPGIRYTPEVRAAQEAVLENEAPRCFPVDARRDREDESVVGLFLPLRVRERAVGVLEVYGPKALAENDVVEILESLTTQAASSFENARLYGELADSAERLQELVGKILVAQEEERRRVAYEVHDGLAQVAAAAHQHLQAFAQYHPPQSQEGREELKYVSGLVRRTVGEARRIIADLRPTALDDFGLKSAIRLHLDALRAEGWRIAYEDSLSDERLPAATETAIFRVVQEALNNIGKHADTKRVNLSLEQRLAEEPAPSEGGRIRLRIRDYGRGFAPESSASRGGPGERVGMTGMRERITLLGGEFRVASRPGVGTLIVAEIPLLGGSAEGSAENLLDKPAGPAGGRLTGATDGR